MNNMKVRLALLVCSMALAGLLVACGDSTPTPALPVATTASTTTAPTGTTAAAPTTAAASQTTTAGVSPLATATAPAVTTAAPTTAVPATTAPAATTAAPVTTQAATTAPATTQAPAATTAPATTSGTGSGQTIPVSGSPADVNKDLFIDDRTDALQVVRSFYNAINRKEYVRAYSYWNTSGQVPAYAQFEQGYKDTDTVQFYVGSITGDAGAGQRYYGVPFSLKSTSTNGAVAVYAGCYTIHQAVPANFGAPPFQPMGIESANVQQVQGNATAADLMAKSCQATGNPPVTISPVPANDSAVDASLFLDDRSTPEAVIRSYYNAINRKEYVRAYSYFTTPGTSATSQPPAYAQFEQGYKDTASVQLTTGTPTSDAGAGQLNYTVPVTLTVKQADGSTQTFSGTYTLHKSQPANFGAPPFIPLGIVSAAIQKS